MWVSDLHEPLEKKMGNWYAATITVYSLRSMGVTNIPAPPPGMP